MILWFCEANLRFKEDVSQEVRMSSFASDTVEDSLEIWMFGGVGRQISGIDFGGARTYPTSKHLCLSSYSYCNLSIT